MKRVRKNNSPPPGLTPERRAQILTAAMRRFLQYGVRKTAMREIAGDCGLAVGTLYLSFANKDALIIGCADLFRSVHAAESDAIVAAAGMDPEAKLRRYVLARYHAARGIRAGAPEAAAELARHVLRLRPDDPESEARRFQTNLGRILVAGRAAGAFPGLRDPEREARVFALALGVFFPIPGREPLEALGQADILNQIDWFLEVWTKE